MIQRRAVAAVITALLGVLAGPVSAQESPDAAAACIGRSGPVTATVGIHQLPAAVEIDLLLANQGPGTVQFDPSKAVLRTAESTASPWSAAETKRAHRDWGAYILAGGIFPMLLPLPLIAQLNFNRYVDSRAFRAAEVQPGQTARGSLFFPLPPDRQTRAVLELGGPVPASGGSRPLKMYCGLPRDESPGAPQVPTLTVSVDATGRSGAADVRVDTVEFSADYTAVELSISNRSETSAEIFMAMVNASLRDSGGLVYTQRSIRSQFVDRIPARSSVFARLVFAAMPPTTTAASLRIPGVWFGPENSVDVTVDLKF